MPLVAEYLSVDELAAFDEDKPILVGSHAADWPRWRDADLDDPADLAEPGFEGFWAADRAGLAISKPSDGLAEINLVFALTAPAGFDMLAIVGLGAGFTIDFDIADDAAFTTNLTPLLVDAVPTGNRFVAWHLGDESTPQRFSGTGFGRIKFTGASTPEVRELWIGRRRQMRRFPDNPFDGEATGSRTASPGDEFGAELAHPLYFGRGNLRAPFTTATDEEAAEVRAWHRECGHGTRPFLWCLHPKTQPHHVGIYLGKPGLAMPLHGPTSRTFTVEGLEQTPFMVDAPPIPVPLVNTRSLRKGTNADYLRINNNTLGNAAPLSIAFAIRRDSWSTGGGEIIVRANVAPSDWYVTTSSNGRLTLGIGATFWTMPVNTFTVGPWHRCALVYAGAGVELRFWRAGSEVTLSRSGPNAGIPGTAPQPIQIGLRGTATNRLTSADLDEYAIWNAALTPEQAIAVTSGFMDFRTIAGLVSWWRFEDDFNDFVGGNHAELVTQVAVGTGITFQTAVP